MRLVISLEHPEIGLFDASVEVLEHPNGNIYVSEPTIYELPSLFGEKDLVTDVRPQLRPIFSEEHGEWVREQTRKAAEEWLLEGKR